MTFRAGRAGGCADTCLLFPRRNGDVLACAWGLTSPGVSAFNNLGVLLLLRVAWGFPQFRAVLGSPSWGSRGGSAPAAALPSPVLPAALPASPRLLLARTLPALFSLGHGVMP